MSGKRAVGGGGRRGLGKGTTKTTDLEVTMGKWHELGVRGGGEVKEKEENKQPRDETGRGRRKDADIIV